MTGRTRLNALEADLTLAAEGCLLKAQLHLGDDVLTLRRAASACGRRCTAAEEIAENIAEIAEAAESAKAAEARARVRVEVRIDAREAILIVARLFIRVGQHLVGLVDLLELLLRALVAGILVGMVLHRQLPVGLLDLRVGGVFLDAEHLVIISLILICHLSLTSISVETAERGGIAAPDLLHVSIT